MSRVRISREYEPQPEPEAAGDLVPEQGPGRAQGVSQHAELTAHYLTGGGVGPSPPVVISSRAQAPRAAEAQVGVAIAEAQQAVEVRAQRQAQRAQQRRWAKRNASQPEKDATTVHDAFRDHEGSLDHLAAVAGTQRREALQAATSPRYRAHQRGRWDAAIALHEPMGRASTDDHVMPEIGPEGPAQWVSLTPERDLRAETAAQTIQRISSHQSHRIKPQHAVAHFMVSWQPAHEVTPGEAVVTGRRLLARVGVDVHRQACAGYLHHDGATQHLHLVVARTRDDGGVWTAGLGIDRALALESRLMALEHQEAWDQRMIARSGQSKGALRLLEEGMLGGYIVHVDGTRERIDYQGAAVTARMEGDLLTLARHGGANLAKMIGLRRSAEVINYCAR